jgi:hypothetical protein
MTYTSTSTSPEQCLFLYAINRVTRTAAEFGEADTPRELTALIKRAMHHVAGQCEMPADWLRYVDKIGKLYANVSIETMRECLIGCADLTQPAEAARYFELTGEKLETLCPDAL